MLAAGFYGILDRAKRRDSWNLFRTLAANICFPWCVMGDFNDLLSNEDKCGRVEHPFWLMQGFQEAVGDCGLRDIVLEDYPFTWVKSKSIDSAVEERLDRGPWLIVIGSRISQKLDCSICLLLSWTILLLFFTLKKKCGSDLEDLSCLKTVG